jgi:putative peptide zinc metalloprotease protein
MQPLFSEHWHIVRALRPSLREGVQVLPRMLRGRQWVLLHDPVTHRFIRVTPALWQVLKLMNGVRTLEEVWTAACLETPGTLEGQAAPATVITQHELVNLLSQLYAQDLLQTQVSPDAAEIFMRYRKQKKNQLKQSVLNPISIKIPLIYPDEWFSQWAGLARMLFSWPILLVWLAVVLPAGMVAWEHWGELTNNISDQVLSASNLVVLWFTYPVVKTIHETAHGLAVKAWGGTVREMGLMFLIFAPVPYVDATSSYQFPSKWARAMVAAAGIFAELFLGAIALYIWVMSEPGLTHAIAFNVILIAGISTLLVNGNPLMRYDGYFVLCDLLELPNLGQRSTQYWVYLSDHYLFGATDAEPPIGSDREWPWLLVYGLVSPIYRMFITIGLIWLIAVKYFFVGVLMALFSAWTSILKPLWKGWKHVHDGGTLARYRPKAKRRLLWGIVVFFLLVVVIPMPFYSVQQAVVWLPDAALVRADEAAHIQTALVKSEDFVHVNQPLVTLENPELAAEQQVASSEVESLQVQIRNKEVEEPLEADRLRPELVAAITKNQSLHKQMQALELRAHVDGRWVPAQPTQLAGRFVQRGDVVGYVIAGPAQLLRVAVPQDDMNLIRTRLQRVQVRLATDLRTSIAARISRRIPEGSETLLSSALGTSGGGEIAVDPAKQEGTKALQRTFDLELTLDHPVKYIVYGDRAYVRFDLGWAPLAWQWTLRLRQLFLARFYV